jgi:creatinine amidohydrolase/Fe(II)-dependent formamide hydrolase-like protein
LASERKAAMTLPKRNWMEMTWQEIAGAETGRWIAVLPAGFAWMTQDLNPNGAVGDATLAGAQKGKAALAHGAQAFVELLREIDRFDLARLREGPLGK